jgi:hypothetical protein
MTIFYSHFIETLSENIAGKTAHARYQPGGAGWLRRYLSPRPLLAGKD